MPTGDRCVLRKLPFKRLFDSEGVEIPDKESDTFYKPIDAICEAYWRGVSENWNVVYGVWVYNDHQVTSQLRYIVCEDGLFEKRSMPSQVFDRHEEKE